MMKKLKPYGNKFAYKVKTNLIHYTFTQLQFSHSFLSLVHSFSKQKTTIPMAVQQRYSTTSGSSSGGGSGSGSSEVEVESVKCASCGLTEECTPTYILRIRERYKGKWICGLCAEAVKDEVLRSDRLISIDEALNRHISFYKSFRSTPKTEYPISVMGRILRRSLDNSSSSSSSSNSPPRVPLRSNSSSILPDMNTVQGPSSLLRSESCFSSLSR